MSYKSTLQVSRILGVTVGRLSRAVWNGRISAPTKGPGNAFLWTKSDIERASWVLLHRTYESTESENECTAYQD